RDASQRHLPRVSSAKPKLRGIAPCGVRTFLPRLSPEAILRLSKTALIIPGKLGGAMTEKLQIPSNKLQRNTKPQTPTGRLGLKIWSFSGAWSLINNRQIHIPRVIQNASAIDAPHQFILRLAGHNRLRRQFHMATTAHTVL